MAETLAPDRSTMSGRKRPDRHGRFGRFGRTLVALEIFLAVNALGGGIYLMTDPDSAMPIEWLDGTPLGSWFWPGVALIVSIAVLPATVIAAAFRARPYARPGHMLAGAVLVGWICIQLAVIGYVSWMQPLMLALGLILVALGTANARAWQREQADTRSDTA